VTNTTDIGAVGDDLYFVLYGDEFVLHLFVFKCKSLDGVWEWDRIRILVIKIGWG
jgi:hypothetical protein